MRENSKAFRAHPEWRELLCPAEYSTVGYHWLSHVHTPDLRQAALFFPHPTEEAPRGRWMMMGAEGLYPTDHAILGFHRYWGPLYRPGDEPT